MTHPRVIFHYPGHLAGDPAAGSQTRVVGMLGGFRSLGADVEPVVGTSRERASAMRRIAAAARSGTRFDAVYSEFTTAPIVLSDPDHLPRRPLIDFRFFRAMRDQGCPVGVYYRDAHWRFPPYAERVPRRKRWPALAAYRFEMAGLRCTADVLFVPSHEMAAHLPGWRDDRRVSELPPGGEIAPGEWRPRPGKLRLLYVGAVTPPVYDVSPLLDAVVRTKDVELVLCCPKVESVQLTRWLPAPNVTVVHESAGQLAARYAACDAACIVYGPDPYRSLAMPVKLFESLGHGRPLLATNHDLAGRFVAAHGLGWAVDPSAVGDTLQQLVRNPTAVRRAHDAVMAVRHQHTWSARAQQALDTLESNTPTGRT